MANLWMRLVFPGLSKTGRFCNTFDSDANNLLIYIYIFTDFSTLSGFLNKKRQMFEKHKTNPFIE